jgi:IMP and pyridine-specific 5'-nucleotidase
VLQSSAANELSEWIKGLLAVPFVLHSQPTGVFESREGSVTQMAETAHRRYAEIMKDIEDMIDDHSTYHSALDHRLKMVPVHV